MSQSDLPHRAALIRVKGRDSLSVKALGRPAAIVKDGVTSLGASGLLLSVDPPLVLTSLAAFTPFIRKRPLNEPVILAGEVEVHVLFDEDVAWRKATVERSYFCEDASKVLDSLASPQSFSSHWIIGWSNDNENGGEWNLNDLLSVVLLRFDAAIPLSKPPTSTLLPASHTEITRGTLVHSAASPHALHFPEGLLGYVSHGVISNTFGNHEMPALFSVDMTTLPGMEGGLVYTTNNRFAGLLIPPLRRRNTSITISLCLPTTLFWPKLAPLLPNSIARSPSAAITRSLEGVLEPLILISIGSAWCSGICISPEGRAYAPRSVLVLLNGTDILTCAHVFGSFGETEHSRLRVRYKSDWFPAQVLFISTSYIDVAILKVTKSAHIPPVSKFLLPLTGSELAVGYPVLVAGHGLFSPQYRLNAGVSRGVISKLVHHQGELVMVASDCHVHSGASGGMLLDANTHSLIAIVTTNTQSSHGITYARLNSSLPITLIHGPLFRFLHGDNDALKVLSLEVPERKAIWAMQTLLKPETSPSSKPSEFSSFVENLKSKL